MHVFVEPPVELLEFVSCPHQSRIVTTARKPVNEEAVATARAPVCNVVLNTDVAFDVDAPAAIAEDAKAAKRVVTSAMRSSKADRIFLY